MRKFIALVVFFALFSISAPVLALDAPTLTVTTSDVNVTLSWTSVPGATGYTLFYAPYPDASYIGQIDMGTQTNFSFDASGLAFYVAIQSYNISGSSAYSNIEFFDISSSPDPRYSFPSDSALLTHPYYTMSVGDQWTLNVNGIDGIIEAESIESVNGISCLKVVYSDIVWLAQDVEGNIHVLKVLLGNGKSFAAGNNSNESTVFLPKKDNLKISTSWEWKLYNQTGQGYDGLYSTVASLNATYENKTGCLKIEEYWIGPEASKNLSTMYYKENVGLVGRE